MKTKFQEAIWFAIVVCVWVAVVDVVVVAVVDGVVDAGSPNTNKVPINDVQTVLHDGCEYLVVENGHRGGNNYSFSMCHKGNCTNVIHRTNHP